MHSYGLDNETQCPLPNNSSANDVQKQVESSSEITISI